MLDKATYDRILKDVPTFRFISPAILIERLKVNGSLARIAIRHLEKEGHIRRIVHHNGQLIYSKCPSLNRRLALLFLTVIFTQLVQPVVPIREKGMVAMFYALHVEMLH